MTTAVTPVRFNIAVQHDNEFAVDLRELHTELLSRQDFSTWSRKRLSQFVESEDFVIFNKVVEKSVRGRPSIDYAVTLDTAKEIAMMENTGRGRDVRRYFIAVEKAYRAQIAQATDFDRILAELKELRAEVAEVRSQNLRLESLASLGQSSSGAVKCLPAPQQREQEAGPKIAEALLEHRGATFSFTFQEVIKIGVSLGLDLFAFESFTERLPRYRASREARLGKVVVRILRDKVFSVAGRDWQIEKKDKAHGSRYRAVLLN